MIYVSLSVLVIIFVVAFVGVTGKIDKLEEEIEISTTARLRKDLDELKKKVDNNSDILRNSTPK